MNPENDPRWNDPDLYYYPKGEGSWHWIGDYDPNDPRNADDDWAYLPKVGGWVWIGPEEGEEAAYRQFQQAPRGLQLTTHEILLRVAIAAIGLLFVVALFVL